MEAQPDAIPRAAAFTARDLIGGIAIAVALGALADALPPPLLPRRAIDVVVALSITLLAGWAWGRDMATLALAPDPRVAAKLTTFSVGPAIIAAGAILAAVEPTAVARATRAGYSIHFMYSMLFVRLTTYLTPELLAAVHISNQCHTNNQRGSPFLPRTRGSELWLRGSARSTPPHPDPRESPTR